MIKVALEQKSLDDEEDGEDGPEDAGAEATP